MRVVRSRDNALYKTLLKLGSSPRERKRAELTLLDGEHLIESWRDAGMPQAEIIAASESAMERPQLRALLESTPARIRLILADGLLAHVAQVASSAGVLAAVKPPEAPVLPDRIEDGLFLEDVQDPGNLGSMLRTAVAAGLTHVFLSPASAAVWSPKVLRAGMGAHFRLSIFEDVKAEQLAERAGGLVVATEPEASASLYQTDLRRPVLWLFGNEGAGLTQKAAGLATARIRIPMPGPAESLNVGASLAVCLFEQARQRGAC
jgi:RNA methyltransferase, TrmH family